MGSVEIKSRIRETTEIIYGILLKKDFFIIETILFVFSIMFCQYFSIKTLSTIPINVYIKLLIEVGIFIVGSSIIIIIGLMIKNKIKTNKKN